MSKDRPQSEVQDKKMDYTFFSSLSADFLSLILFSIFRSAGVFCLLTYLRHWLDVLVAESYHPHDR